MKYFVLFILGFFGFIGTANSQQNGEVKSIQLYPKGNEVGLPIIALNTNQQLHLEFDILGEDAPYVYYEIQHFNSDWTKQDLNSLDFVKGFSTGSIDNFDFSFDTKQLYTHYEFIFPNDQVRLAASGNYKIVVFEDSADNPLFAKEFYVTEQRVAITGSIENAVGISQLDSHHQIHFAVNYEGLTVNSPRQEIRANVMQNYRKDNMLIDVKPSQMRQNELVYSNPFKQNFEAGNEFRWFNTKSTRFKTEGVAEIIKENNRVDVWLMPDLARQKSQFLTWNDYNGQYMIDHHEGRDADVDADYVYVHFTLKETPAIKNKPVYVFAGLTNWEQLEQARMKMNTRQNLLEAVLYLKQGNYDYMYVVEENGHFTTKPIEGNFYRTENHYTVFIYYSPFGARYDRLVGVKAFTSRF